jgi:hypothetical protein
MVLGKAQCRIAGSKNGVEPPSAEIFFKLSYAIGNSHQIRRMEWTIPLEW